MFKRIKNRKRNLVNVCCEEKDRYKCLSTIQSYNFNRTKEPYDDIVERIEKAYCNKYSLEELRNRTKDCVENKDNKWIAYESICYYGGCLFDAVEFNSEYEARKHAYIIRLFKKIYRVRDGGDSHGTVIRDINSHCEKLNECMGV